MLLSSLASPQNPFRDYSARVSRSWSATLLVQALVVANVELSQGLWATRFVRPCAYQVQHVWLLAFCGADRCGAADCMEAWCCEDAGSTVMVARPAASRVDSEFALIPVTESEADD
jgi:hypothetical protein